MTLGIAILIYTSAIVLANLAVAYLGPGITGITAFVMIGLDLALRDWLHFKLKAWQMGLLIVSSGFLTYLLNASAESIAIASATAFTAAAIADWFTFNTLPGSWLLKAHGSNLSGALVDSLLFPILAFGELMPDIFLAQFSAKILGGGLWTYLIRRYWRSDHRQHP